METGRSAVCAAIRCENAKGAASTAPATQARVRATFSVPMTTASTVAP